MGTAPSLHNGPANLRTSVAPGKFVVGSAPRASRSVVAAQDTGWGAKTAQGQSRRFDLPTMTSGLPHLTDIFRTSRHVSKVPTADISADSNLQPGRYERSTPSE